MAKKVSQSVLLIIISLFAFFVLVRDIDKPFWGHHDWNSNIWTVTAKNNLVRGIACTRLGQSTTSNPDIPCNQLSFYMNHPPLISWILTVFYALFGYAEWVGRLPLVLFSFGSIFLIYLIGKDLFNPYVGFAACLFAIATPMFQYFGKLINHEPLVLFFNLLAVYSYLEWTKLNQNKYYAVFIISAVFTGISGWQGYFIFPLLFLVTIKFFKAKWRLALIPFFILLATFFLHLWHIFILARAWNTGLIEQLLRRIYGGDKNSLDAAITQFSYPKFIKQEIVWLHSYFSALLPFLGSLFIGTILFALFKKKTIPFSSWIVIILGINGALVPLLFSQQAFIHDYLLLYLLPFFSVSSAIIIIKNKFTKRYPKLSWGVIFACTIFVFTEKQAFVSALFAREVERPYVELAQIIKYQGNKSGYLIEADNFYNFAYPFLWNYCYGYKIDGANDTLATFLKQQQFYEHTYTTIITVNSNPVDPDLSEFLKKTYNSHINGQFTFHSLQN